jgi:hypothetical protein
MNRFKCPACGGNQYTACDTAEWCIYCGHQKLEKMDKLEPDKSKQPLITGRGLFGNWKRKG